MKIISNRRQGLKSKLRRFYSEYYGLIDKTYWVAGDRFRMLEQAFVYTGYERVGGDYLEFGVARGRSLIWAYKIAKRYPKQTSSQDTKFIGFDSFEGFQKPTGVDAIFERFKEGEEYHGGKIVVERHMKRHHVDLSRVKLVQGFYNKTLNEDTTNQLQLVNRKARIVNIDCDMYESAYQALSYVGSFLQNGTVVLFDDWFCYRGDPEKGEQRAASKWLQENKNIELIPYRSYAHVGMSFICKVKI